MIIVDSVKISPLLQKCSKCQCFCAVCSLHNKFAYYAGIMLDAFVILLYSQLCLHSRIIMAGRGTPSQAIPMQVLLRMYVTGFV